MPVHVHWLNQIGSAGRTRTYDMSVNSRPLYRLSYRGAREGAGAHDSRRPAPRRQYIEERQHATTANRI